MRQLRIVVIGAGMGGLAAAIALAHGGCEVVLVERAGRPGGKLREVAVGAARIDSGPTVFTMRGVFDDLFAAAGASFGDAVDLRPLDVLARHAWTGDGRLDLYSGIERSTDAIGRFAGSAEARGYRDFCERARRIHDTLEPTFMKAARPSMIELVRRIGPSRLGRLKGISPFSTLAKALEEHFADPRLRQLFGRYATYCGSSPYEAPATLMLIAHVEREGVWAIEGGMRRLAEAMAALAVARGAAIRCGEEAVRIVVTREGASAVELRSGERLPADAVVYGADGAALSAGLMGPDAAGAVSPMAVGDRSFSAVTYSLTAEVDGGALAHHNVVFSDDSRREFDALAAGVLPEDPTVYVCAPDRREGVAPSGPERLFLILNAPAHGDRTQPDPTEAARCEERTFRRLARSGLNVRRQPGSTVATTPADFARLFPGTGGALYGRASHGWMASFRRPGSRTRVPRLYLAGGSAHPGAGVPMAAISGRLAAAALMEDLGSTRRFHPAATRGGMSTR